VPSPTQHPYNDSQQAELLEFWRQDYQSNREKYLRKACSSDEQVAKQPDVVRKACIELGILPGAGNR
jgi:hypothetical protein